MRQGIKSAARLHNKVPADWYFRSIRENPLQKYWHNKRFREVTRVIEPADRILDIGSADGVFTRVIFLKSKAKEIHGIDVLESSIEWARKHWRNEKMKFRVGDAHNLRFAQNTFDAVFALEVLEHVADPAKALKEVKRVLKKGGYGVFLVPTDSLLFRSIWFFWTRWRGKIWQKTHIQTYRNNYLSKLSEKEGFEIDTNRKFLLGMLQITKVRKK